MKAGKRSPAGQPCTLPQVWDSDREGEWTLVRGFGICHTCTGACSCQLQDCGILSLAHSGLSEAPCSEGLEKLADVLFVDLHTLGLQKETWRIKEVHTHSALLSMQLHSPHLQNSFSAETSPVFILVVPSWH